MASEVVQVLLTVRDGASAPLKAAGAAAAQAVPQVRALEGGLKALATPTSNAGQQLHALKMILSERLGPTLSMINPRLGLTAMSVGRVAESFTLLGGSLTGALGVLAPLAAGLGVVYLVVKDSREQVAALAEKVRVLNEEILPERVKAYAKAWADFNSIAEDLGVQLAVLEGHLTAEEAATMKRVQAVRAAGAAQREALDSEIQTTRELLLNLDRLKAKRGSLTTEEQTALETNEALLSSLYDQRKELEKGGTQLVEQANLIGDVTSRVKTATQTTKQHTAALKENREEMEKMPAFGPSSIPQAPVQNENIGTSAYWANYYQNIKDDERQADTSMLSQARMQEAAWTGIGVASGVANGSVAQVVSQFGVIGGIIGAILSILQKIGRDGGEGVNKEIRTTNHDITQGIKNLPNIISESGVLGTEFATQLSASLMEFLGELIPSLLEAIGGAVEYLIRELPGVFVQALKNIFGGWGWGTDDETRIASRAQMGTVGEGMGGGMPTVAYAEGTPYVSRTQLAVVHQGEEIVSEGGRSTRGRSGFGGGVSITINGFVGPEALAELDRQMRAYAGLGMTWGT